MQMRVQYEAPKMSGSSLREIRKKKALNLSQADVGRITGYSREAVGIWERGDGPPLAVAQLMWLLEKHPELVPEILERAGIE